MALFKPHYLTLLTAGVNVRQYCNFTRLALSPSLVKANLKQKAEPKG